MYHVFASGQEYNGHVIIQLKQAQIAKSFKIDQPPREERELVTEVCSHHPFFNTF